MTVIAGPFSTIRDAWEVSVIGVGAGQVLSLHCPEPWVACFFLVRGFDELEGCGFDRFSFVLLLTLALGPFLGGFVVYIRWFQAFL
jgi:hypothetical protein